MENRPNYRKLYADMIRDKYPEKVSECASCFEKEEWTALDVIRINEKLFGSQKRKSDLKVDRAHRAYDIASIRDILAHQRKDRLNNKQLAVEYGLSRNTVAKWKKLFQEELTIDN